MLRTARKLIRPLEIAKKLQSGVGTCEADKVAVVLSGCGVYDGSEVHEACHVLSHLTRNNALPILFAPDKPQMDVIDHTASKVQENEKRNVLKESARIARGNIQPLSKLVETQRLFNAVIFPGGFGVAKNLSDFATKGPSCTIDPNVETIIKDFHKQGKPIGLMCIAPILAARLICGVTITLGKDACDGWPHRDAIKAAEAMGAIVESRGVNETSFDRKNKVFSTPAYMYEGKYHEIDDGIGSFVKYLLINMRQGEK